MPLPDAGLKKVLKPKKSSCSRRTVETTPNEKLLSPGDERSRVDGETLGFAEAERMEKTKECGRRLETFPRQP